jgi:hypothetical protein
LIIVSDVLNAPFRGESMSWLATCDNIVASDRASKPKTVKRPHALHGRGAPLVVGNVTGSLPVNVRFGSDKEPYWK